MKKGEEEERKRKKEPRGEKRVHTCAWFLFGGSSTMLAACHTFNECIDDPRVDVESAQLVVILHRRCSIFDAKTNSKEERLL